MMENGTIELGVVDRDFRGRFLGRRNIHGTGAALANELLRSKSVRVDPKWPNGSPKSRKVIAAQLDEAREKLADKMFGGVE